MPGTEYQSVRNIPPGAKVEDTSQFWGETLDSSWRFHRTEVIPVPTNKNGVTLKYIGIGLKPCLRNRVQLVPE